MTLCICPVSCCPSSRADPTSARRPHPVRRCGRSRAARPQPRDDHLLDSAAVSKAEKRERQRENRERAREERERLLRRQRQMKTFRSLLIVLVPIMVILIVVSLTSGGSDSKSTKASTNPLCKNPVKDPQRTFGAAPPNTIDPSQTYTATICTSEGDITLALDPTKAPIATNNFVFLAQNGFYDGLTFHRASKDFVIQGGD